MPSEAEKRLAFWRKANVWIASPYERITKLLGVLTGLLVLGLGVWILGKSIPDFPSAAVAVAVAVSGGLLALCRELWHKGGNAGAELQDARDELDKSAKNDGDRRAAAMALTEARQQLSLIQNYGLGSAPQPSTEGHYAERVMQFTIDLRTRTVACLESCNERTAVIPNASLEVESIKPLVNAFEIIRKIERRLEMIDTLQKTL
jgi:hypothetical protein